MEKKGIVESSLIKLRDTTKGKKKYILLPILLFMLLAALALVGLKVFILGGMDIKPFIYQIF